MLRCLASALLVLPIAFLLSSCPPVTPDDGDNPGTGGGEPGVPGLGVNASMNGAQIFPADNPWNTPVDTLPVDPNSDDLIDSIGRYTTLHPDFGANWNGGPFGIPYIVVSGDTPRVNVTFQFASESDTGPYPIASNAPIEGGPNSSDDRHIITIDRDNRSLYELYAAYPPNRTGDPWRAGSGAIWDMDSNDLRPAGDTSADAAGLPIFPGLVRYDEVYERGEINHALRFTVSTSRRAYVYPARHSASSHTDSDLPPMGMRVRLKASFDISGFSEANQVVLRALKKYGMMVADNGSDWYISGVADARWDDDELRELKGIEGGNFEVVEMGAIVTN